MDTGKSTDKTGKILAVLTVVMTIVFVISIFSLIMTVRIRHNNEPVRVNSFINDLRNGRYADLIDSWHENTVMGVDSEEYAPYYDIARYCENAAYYKVYSDKGDKKRCEELLLQMKKTVPDLKESDILIEEINKTFGIPEV